VLDAANTAPMMSRRRLVIVRAIERLERAGGGDDDRRGSPSDALADWLQKPMPTTCLLLVGGKVDGRRRLATVAKKTDAWVACEPLKHQQLGGFVRDEVKRRGHAIAGEVVEAIVELIGADLAALVDAIERLSLYVGPGAAIDEDAVHACVARVRVGSVWGLADAVVGRDLRTAIRLLDENYDPQDRGIPLLGLLAASMRKTLRLRALLDEGASNEEAAKVAGIPPFRAREAAQLAKGRPRAELEHALAVLSEADLALKGSRRPPLLILEEAIARMV
jgi:DNA polymerase-3 subunit delta